MTEAGQAYGGLADDFAGIARTLLFDPAAGGQHGPCATRADRAGSPGARIVRDGTERSSPACTLSWAHT